MQTLEAIITQVWHEIEAEPLSPNLSQGPFKDAVLEAIDLLDLGKARVLEKKGEGWHLNAWLKQAILLYFRVSQNHLKEGILPAFDKVPLKFEGWSADQFQAAGVRIVPGAVIRKGAYLSSEVIVMPSFINIGAYVDRGTMIDSYATVGSCAQIGQRCHISSGVVIGGVLEPVQSRPVIVEDNCFIGAQSTVVEGVHVEQGAVIGMGVSLGASTALIDRETGETFYGRVPAYSVVVPGTLPARVGKGGVHMACAVIVKKVTPETRQKTAINELLRV